MKNLSVRFAAILLLLSTPSVFAKPTTQDFKLWSAVFSQTSLDSVNYRLKIWLDVHARFDDHEGLTTTQAIIRPGIGYEIADRFTVWLGYAWTPIWVFERIDEHRIWQQFMWTYKSPSGISFMARTRIEERFYENQPEVGYRLREFLRFSVPITNLIPLDAVVWDEPFFKFNTTQWSGTSGFDQNRLFVGPAYHLTPEMRLEAGYMNQMISRPNRWEINHIFQMSLFLSL